MSNLPNWPGAASCYSRAYALLERKAKAGHVERLKRVRRHGPTCTVSEEMSELIRALDRGDEEAIKAALLADRFPLPPLAKSRR